MQLIDVANQYSRIREELIFNIKQLTGCKKDITLSHIKQFCKKFKKIHNPRNLSLMKIQHQVAFYLGFKDWKELRDYYIIKDLVRKGEENGSTRTD